MSSSFGAGEQPAHLLVSESNPLQTVLVPWSRDGLTLGPCSPPSSCSCSSCTASSSCTSSCCSSSSQESLTDGRHQVLVRIEKLVVTANTVTYALAGNLPVLKYFQHFQIPDGAPPGLAMSPCWGHGVVVASRSPEVVAVGTRLHGLFPFSPTVVLTLQPTRSPTAFFDSSPRRAKLVDIYKMYFTADDPTWKGLSADEEDYQMSTGQLFSTGWSMAHVAAVQQSKPAALLMTSASSRTSRAAAFAAKHDKLPLKVIGLTSTPNLEFVRSLRLYDEVYEYGHEGSLPLLQTAFHDVAGSAPVRRRIYERLGKNIVYSSVVGLAHAGAAGLRADLDGLGGAKPFSFFVMTALDEVGRSYGKGTLNDKLSSAAAAFNAEMLPHFRVARHFGPAATRDVFDRTARGEVDPTITQVCSLWPEQPQEQRRSKL